MPTLANALEKNFVYLTDYNQNIQHDLRYFGEHNFLNHRVNGYKRNVVMLTREAAMALLKAESILNKQGYSLVIYDTYRPEKAVQHFVEWSQTDDATAKLTFYPRVAKLDLFTMGYVSNKSTHSRGSTVDLSIIKMGQPLHAPVAQPRKFSDGTEFLYLADGTLDMGTAFDFLDELSWPSSTEVSAEAQKNRAILSSAMVEAGFIPYDKEWWHFTLANEPFPDTYFDFDVE